MRNVTVLIVEQLVEFALSIADRAIVMSRGSVTASGRPDQVKAVLELAHLGREAGLVTKTPPAG